MKNSGGIFGVGLVLLAFSGCNGDAFSAFGNLSSGVPSGGTSVTANPTATPAPVFPLGLKGANVMSTYAVTGDDAGNYYVSGSYNSLGGTHVVQKFDSNWNPKYIIGNQLGNGTDNNSLYLPCGLRVFNDKLYIADRLNHRVQVYQASTGTYLFTIGTGTAGSATNQLNNPIGLTVANNKLYVADSGNNRIQIYGLDGTYIESRGTSGSGTTGVVNFTTPYDISADASGNFWIADKGNNRAIEFDSSWNFVLKTDSSNGSTTAFNYPSGIFASGNRVYVSDYTNRKIVILDQATGAFVANTATPTLPFNLNSPRLLSVVAGKLFVPDYSPYSRIFTYSLDGTNPGTVGTTSITNPGLFGPRGMAVIKSTGEYWVGDSVTCQLKKYSASGAYELSAALTNTIACAGSVADSQLTAINSIDTDTDGNVYVMESSTTGSLQKYSATGAFVWRKGGSGTTDGLTKGIAIRVSGTKVYVADYGNPRVSVFNTADGSFLNSFTTTSSTTTSGNLSGVSYSLAVTGGAIYVGELYTGCRIQKFDQVTFAPLQTINLCTATGLANPNAYSMRVKSNGDLYIADYLHNYVIVLDSTGALKGHLGAWDNSQPQNTHFWPSDVDFDSAGNAYVAWLGSSQISKYNASLNEVYY